jgi:hypothetical protein
MTTVTNSKFKVHMQHNKHSQAAITSVARALEANAAALDTLAATIEVRVYNVAAIKIDNYKTTTKENEENEENKENEE